MSGISGTFQDNKIIYKSALGSELVTNGDFADWTDDDPDNWNVYFEDRIIEILQHDIDYWYSEDQEMPEHEEEHVKEMIIQGFSSGQLIDTSNDSENIGWWKIN